MRELIGMDTGRLLHSSMVLNYDTGQESILLDFLPPDRREQLSQTLDEDDAAIQAVWLRQEPGGSLPQSALHDLNLTMQKRNDDLARILSGPELDEYNLRNSQLAKDLRRLENLYKGKVYFPLEPLGSPSRWNTLRARRVLRWWEGEEGELTNGQIEPP